ncbi:MAG TPA: SDR family oxidoreductase [Anaerolineales bacterium]|nr:SDR family oxidoreductase [Anaerolineales bacterium]
MSNSPLILVTGATGYVGGRLVPRLLEAGYRVRCLVRDPKRLEGRPWLRRVEVVTGDALVPDTLHESMRDVSAAYYLIHGKQGGQVNANRDLDAARNFAQAAAEAGIERIIYLGELVDPTTNLSPYLRARHETGAILRHNRVPVTELRAGMLVGSGSALFEMIRYLTEREPVLICPAWFFSEAQPIGIRDVLSYLIEALKTPESAGRMIEIGGPTRLTYADMLLGYARERGLKRLLIRTPFYAPRLSAYWVHMVTPIHWRVVLPLIEGLRARLIVRDEAARKLFPQIQPMDFKTAVHLALGRIQRDNVETSWSDALVTVTGDVKPYQWTIEEGMFVEMRHRLLDLLPEDVFRSYTGIGGERGWLYMDWAWGMRGWLDKAVGGVGLRRGRRHPDEVRAGEALDFWRVEEVEKNRLLRLRAEMRLPGKAWLQFESQPQAGKTLLIVTAYFAPHGLFGFLYWYAMWPFHKFIFDGLANRIASRARVLAHSY